MKIMETLPGYLIITNVNINFTFKLPLMQRNSLKSKFLFYGIVL